MLIQNSPSKIALSANQILDIKDAYKKELVKIEASEPIIDIRRESTPIETFAPQNMSETLNMGNGEVNIFDTFNPANQINPSMVTQNQGIINQPVNQTNQQINQNNDSVDIFKTIPNDLFTPNPQENLNNGSQANNLVMPARENIPQSEPIINQTSAPTVETQIKETSFDVDLTTALSEKCDLLNRLNEEITIKEKQREIYLEEISEISKKISNQKQNSLNNGVNPQVNQGINPNYDSSEFFQNTQNIRMQQTSQIPAIQQTNQIPQMSYTTQMPQMNQMPQNNSNNQTFGESGAEYTNIFDAPFVNNTGTYQRVA